MARSDPPRGCLGFVEKKLVRLIGVGVLSALLLMNLILAIIAIRATHKLNAPLGFQIFLSIITIILCGVLLWRPLPSFSKKMSYVVLGISALMSLIWAIAWIWLAAAQVKSGNDDDDKTSSDKDTSKDSDKKTGSRRMLLFARADAKKDDDNKGSTAIGCIVLGVFFTGIFIFNTVYAYVRLRQLYPKKYAELDEDRNNNNAFDARMNDDEEQELQPKPGAAYDEHSPERPAAYATVHNDEDDTAYRPEHQTGRLSPPARTGYSPHGQLHSPDPTEYQPPHHQAYGPSYGARPQASGAYAGQQEEGGYNQYYDDSGARTGQGQWAQR